MVDGVIRDLAEVREMGFPVFARGVIPIPGTKAAVELVDGPVRCGGVGVSAGDIVVADEEGIVVTPSTRGEQVLRTAQAKLAREAEVSLDAWEESHRTRINKALAEHTPA